MNNMENKVQKIYDFHLKVLKEILNGSNFDDIIALYEEEFARYDYLNIAKKGLLSFDNEGKLIGAYPVSPKKTDYLVEIEDIGTGYSMCAIDALGIAYSFMKPTKITSKDHKTGEKIYLEIDPRAEVEDHGLYVTYIKSENPDCDPAVDQCPSLNFYTTVDHIEEKEKYSILNFSEALKHSKTVFDENGIKNCIREAIRGSNQFSLSNLLVDVFE